MTDANSPYTAGAVFAQPGGDALHPPGSGCDFCDWVHTELTHPAFAQGKAAQGELATHARRAGTLPPAQGRRWR